MYLLREEKRQQEREKKRKKKDEPNGKRRHIPERRQEGGCVQREARDKARPKAWCKKDEAVLCHRRRVWGDMGAGERLESVSTVFPRVTKSTVGTSPNSATFGTSPRHLPHFCSPAATCVRFFFFFFSFPLTASFLSVGAWDPPLAGKCEGGCPPSFTRARRALLPLTNPRRMLVHFFSSFFFFIC
jgi:hypothetical protein